MGATYELAQFIVETQVNELPDDAVHEAKRCLINFLGVALYASRDPSLGILLGAFQEEGGKPRATIVGTGVRTTLLNAALANGYLGHLEDYDDTHFPTVIHVSSPVFPAILGPAETLGISGMEFLGAFVLGFEAAAHIGLAIHPAHYDLGWHITGTVGCFGAAAAAGKVLGLDTQQMIYALGAAGTQAAGVREVFGSMSKPLHAGRAAQSGLLAAILASKGFTSTTQILEGRRGFCQVLSGKFDLSKVTEGLGKSYELHNNGLKPYACGVVNHPLIDAMVHLRNEAKVRPGEVLSIQARVSPLVIELVNLRHPKVGLESKFSIHHCCAVALVDGAAYPDQFTDARVKDPAIIALRDKVELTSDPSIKEDQVTVRVNLADGRSLERHIEHANGAPKNPMTDAQVEEKFRVLAERTLPKKRVDQLVDTLWNLERIADMSNLTPLLSRRRRG